MKNINDLSKKKKTTKNSSNLKVYFNVWKEKLMHIYLYILGWVINIIYWYNNTRFNETSYYFFFVMKILILRTIIRISIK